MKKLVIGSDKSGFKLKEAVKEHLANQGNKITDVGTRDMANPLPYYEVSAAAARLLQQQKYDRAVLICGTGMGMALVANKFAGIYAAPVESLYAARMCRAINNANILTMGGWIIGPEMAVELVDAFLNTGFTEGLEDWRQDFLKKAEKEVQKIEKAQYISTP